MKQLTISQLGFRGIYKILFGLILLCSLFFISNAAFSDELNLLSLQGNGPTDHRVQNFDGMRNFEYLSAISNSFRVKYPAGSYDPASMKKMSLQYGGANFRYVPGGDYNEKCSLIQYYVRFPENFEFVKGGKLPGLYGGKGNTGGKIPNGKDGFSVRIVWLKGGYGQIYAYLPSSIKWGTGLAKKSWRFNKGKWEKITLLVKLNAANYSNGLIKLWVNDKIVADLNGIKFRTVSSLSINGLLFSTFFGGDDPSFAPSHDQYIDFKEVEISTNMSSKMRCDNE